ncbi:MAG: YhcH/YjgK/YiaL family protein [Victivallales bacterium]|jgi:YhcH/YjgK/YiaL family protein|nr:YhcH/YjgK/YiaL family protein [Victivallales bacterium]
MVFDSLDNFMQYRHLAPEAWDRISKWFAVCTTQTFSDRYELDGDQIYATIQHYQTHDLNLDKLETHKKYVDIQLLLAGKERILVRKVDDLEVTQEYNQAKDCAFYRFKKEGSTTLELVPGKFAMLFPKEGHMPGIHFTDKPNPQDSAVVKVVIKISVSLFSRSGDEE